MNNSTLIPPPPILDGLTWRPFTRDDLPELVELAQTCHSSDGGLPFLFEPDEIIHRFFPDGPGAAIAAWNTGGQLVACTLVTVSGDTSRFQATIVGHVRPDMRAKGLGTYLIHWCQAQARSLLDDAAADQRVLQIRTESLTEPVHRLYLGIGACATKWREPFRQVALQVNGAFPGISPGSNFSSSSIATAKDK